MNHSTTEMSRSPAEEIFSWVGYSAWWQIWFGGQNALFVPSMLGTQLLRTEISLVMISVLLLLGYRRAQFFLVRGEIDAPISPVRWLGFPKIDPWMRFGSQLTIGQIHARNARFLLGLVDPFLARYADILIHGAWFDHARRRVENASWETGG